MAKRVCPWWLGYLLASPLRRLLFENPRALLAPYLREGMTVLEPGPGMGYFTLELARLVGSSGRVIAVDIQPRMLNGLKHRAAKAGLLPRIDLRLATAESMELGHRGEIDFTLAFAMVHEMPDAGAFFAQAAAASKKGAQLLLVEPAGHVNEKEFEAELEAAAVAGFTVVARPAVRRSRSALLRKDA
jgi:ubiquinone/menaquinone biosynthesis C-methylase UbiE